MAKRIKITPELRAYLEESIEKGIPYHKMAAHLGVCTDTVKRICSKLNLAIFSNAKYAFPPPTILWEKPCLKCKCTNPRPKNKYYCDKCKPTSELGNQWEGW